MNTEEMLIAKGYRKIAEHVYSKPPVCVETDAQPFDRATTSPRESETHDAIMAECRRRGWLAIHSRVDIASSVTVGVPDFVIAASQTVSGHGLPPYKEPVTLYVECKRPGGKLRPSQQACRAQLEQNGHFYYIVYSFADFESILRDLNL